MGFRKDINGLRAIAVLAVVIFHFNPSWMPGGFSGVDVFFVISGYLMTSIIFKGITSGSFSFKKFYKARARRIVPALAVVCSLLLVLGWLLLPPIPYSDLAKHSGSSLLFVSNFVYWGESGYFDESSLGKFLLHTWSLSVEWQFYILYPIVLVALSKVSPVATLKKLVVLFTIFGFVFSLYSSYAWATSSYFLFPARAWEMMLGGVAFLYPVNIRAFQARLLDIVALILITCSLFIINEGMSWPGYMSVLPVMGAFLLLQANNQTSWITGNWMLQKIGLWSYSIYLVHWPILVISKRFDYELSFSLYLTTIVILSILLYVIAERRRWSFAAMALLFTAALVASIGAGITNGAEFRVDEKFSLSKSEFHSRYYGGAGYKNQEITSFTRGGEHSYLLSGDSYAFQYYRYIDKNGKDVRAITHNGCLILPDFSIRRHGVEDARCSPQYNNLKEMMRDNVQAPVLIAQSWDEFSSLLIKKGGGEAVSQKDYPKVLLSQLEKVFRDGGDKRNYYLVGIPPKPNFNEFECLSRMSLPLVKTLVNHSLIEPCSSTSPEKTIDINDILKSFSGTHRNVFYIDANSVLCKDGDCLSVVNGEPMHSDMGHLSIYGADIVGEYIFNEVDRQEGLRK